MIKETLAVMKQNVMRLFLPDPSTVYFKTKSDEFIRSETFLTVLSH